MTSQNQSALIVAVVGLLQSLQLPGASSLTPGQTSKQFMLFKGAIWMLVLQVHKKTFPVSLYRYRSRYNQQMVPRILSASLPCGKTIGSDGQPNERSVKVYCSKLDRKLISGLPSKLCGMKVLQVLS